MPEDRPMSPPIQKTLVLLPYPTKPCPFSSLGRNFESFGSGQNCLRLAYEPWSAHGGRSDSRGRASFLSASRSSTTKNRISEPLGRAWAIMGHRLTIFLPSSFPIVFFFPCIRPDTFTGPSEVLSLKSRIHPNVVAPKTCRHFFVLATLLCLTQSPGRPVL